MEATRFSLSNPNRIPQRIVAKLLHQACPQWVSHDISRHFHQIFFSPQCPIMKSLLPKAAFPTGSHAFTARVLKDLVFCISSLNEPRFKSINQ
jgi:hypothetical protein